MPKEFSRTERISGALQQELATLIHGNVRDPRVGMISVTDVNVNHDLSIAKVYVTFVGEREQHERDAGLDALNGAAAYLRKLLASSIKLRTTPKLCFFIDQSGYRGQYLEDLINTALSGDNPLNHRES
jgi:ribosome-binding factor A